MAQWNVRSARSTYLSERNVMENWYQQGDVLLKPVKAIPKGAAVKKGRTLAEGEHTGHSHVAEAEDVELLSCKESCGGNMASKPKSKKLENVPGMLPGMEQKRIGEVHSAAVKLNETMDALAKLRGERKDKEASLIEKMKKHGLTIYEFGQIKVKIDAKETIKVRNVSEDDEDADDEEPAGKVSKDQGKPFQDELDKDEDEPEA